MYLALYYMSNDARNSRKQTEHKNQNRARLHQLWQCPAARTGNTAIAIYWPQRDFSSASSAVTVSCCENWKHSYRHLLTTTRLQLGFICCDSVLQRELETQLSPSTGHNETSARLHLLWQCPAARTGNTAIAIYWPQRDFSSASSAVTVSCCENWKHSYRHLLATTRLQLGFICCDSVLLRELETAIAIYWPQRDFSSASSAVTMSCCENWKHSYRHLLATTRLQLGFICCDSVLTPAVRTGNTAIAIYWPQRDFSSASSAVTVSCCENWKQLSPSTGHNETSAQIKWLSTAASYRKTFARFSLLLLLLLLLMTFYSGWQPNFRCIYHHQLDWSVNH